jgi:UDP-N-acetylmuramate dehydrogenase
LADVAPSPEITAAFGVDAPVAAAAAADDVASAEHPDWDALASELAPLLHWQPRRDVPLAKHTTWHIGGPAALFVTLDSTAEVQAVLRLLTERGLPWTVLGRGSNILAADAGYDGVVLTLGPGLRGSRVDAQAHTITACGGCLLVRIVQQAQAARLAGLEFQAGIPGTVGAAVVGNVGTAQDWISGAVDSVILVRPDGSLTTVRAAQIDWGYRSSSLRGAGIIVEARFQLQPGDAATLAARIQGSLVRRRGTQPLTQPNAGSVFKNPPGVSVGRMIEELGMKGMRIGDAMVSDVHANFIVNAGNATAHDVVALIRQITERVSTQRGITLEPEIRFLGSFASY